MIFLSEFLFLSFSNCTNQAKKRKNLVSPSTSATTSSLLLMNFSQSRQKLVVKNSFKFNSLIFNGQCASLLFSV